LKIHVQSNRENLPINDERRCQWYGKFLESKKPPNGEKGNSNHVQTTIEVTKHAEIVIVPASSIFNKRKKFGNITK